MKKTITFRCLTLAGLVMLGATAAMAKNIYVSSNGAAGGDGTQGKPFATLEEAVKTVAAGDEVHIQGTLSPTATVVVNKNITIVGEGNDATIDGSKVANPLTAATSVTVRNLRFTGATGTAVIIRGGNRANQFAKFDNCTFDNNKGNEGGAAFNYAAHAEFINCTFTNNAAQKGGAIATAHGAYTLIYKSTFSKNTASGDGGGSCYLTASSDVRYSTFVENTTTAKGQGAAIYYMFNDAQKAGETDGHTVKGCAFYKNESVNQGGAIYLSLNQKHNVFNVFSSTFSQNKAAGMGGAIFDRGIDKEDAGAVYNINIVNCTIADNINTNNSAVVGAGVRFTDIKGGERAVNIVNSIIVNNTNPNKPNVPELSFQGNNVKNVRILNSYIGLTDSKPSEKEDIAGTTFKSTKETAGMEDFNGADYYYPLTAALTGTDASAYGCKYDQFGTAFTGNTVGAVNASVNKEQFDDEKVVTDARNLTVNGLATFTANQPLDFSNAGNILAYKAQVDGTTVKLTCVTTVAQGEGVLLRAVNGGVATEAVPFAARAAKASDNAFIGQLYGQETITDGYVLNTVNGQQAFYKAAAAGTLVLAGKAYLPAAAGEAKVLKLVFDGDATGINALNAHHSVKKSDAIYNLNGQRVYHPTHGLYIVNGKKMVIK